MPIAVGAVLLGAIEVLSAAGQECFGLRDYPGSEYYCTESLGPTNGWLEDHFFVLTALGTGALYLLWAAARQVRSSSARRSASTS